MRLIKSNYKFGRNSGRYQCRTRSRVGNITIRTLTSRLSSMSLPYDMFSKVSSGQESSDEIMVSVTHS